MQIAGKMKKFLHLRTKSKVKTNATSRECAEETMRKISALGCSSDLLDLPEMNLRVALATSDVQSILDIPATDEIHMEDGNHGLA